MSRQKGNKDWTRKESDIVEDNAGFMPPSKIVNELRKNGFHRTEMSIRQYCKKRGISVVCQYDSLSLCNIANLLGISRAAVSYWRDSGQLPVRKINRSRSMAKFDDVKKFLQSREFKVKFNEDGLNFFLGK